MKWINALSQAVLISQEGFVVQLNQAASQLWSVSQEKALGRPVLEIVRRHTLEQLLEDGGELEIELSGHSMRCVVIKEAQQSILIVDDQTEYRRRESELREATAILSHEFRTPVTALRGVLEALEYEMPPELSQQFVHQGLQEIERLARLVEDLAVGFRPTRARSISLSEAFERAQKLLEVALTARQTSLIFGQSYIVRADPDKLLQVLLNLIENALKYGQGTVIDIQTVRRDQWVEVAVLDKGASLSDTETLFEAHTRGQHAEGLGSGMGLYIVRSIVSGWGGKAWFERRREYNAFCFTIPLSTDGSI